MLSNARQRIHGIVLAGVHQWDDFCFETVIPRVLVPVAQEPLIVHVLTWLRAGGVCTATICANGESSLVRRMVGGGSELGLTVDYFEDRTPRGPAGCVRDAGLFSDADVFVVSDGSIVPQLDLRALIETHVQSQAAGTVAVRRDRQSCSSRAAGLQPIGIYVFSRSVLSAIPAIGYQDIKEILLPALHRTGRPVVIHEIDADCPRVTGAETYAAVQEWLLEQIGAGTLRVPGYTRVGDAYVHPSARIGEGARLVGSILIGPGAKIAPSAMLVGPTSIGRNTQIGDAVVVCRSTIWDRCVVGANVLLDQCIVTHDVRLMAGESCHGLVVAPDLREFVHRPGDLAGVWKRCS